ncbi:MAG: polysaccharide export protein [Gammaproteobacteria bacterium]|nr:polysaccharide export protein [Gammaproteobacteria bacterium]
MLNISECHRKFGKRAASLLLVGVASLLMFGCSSNPYPDVRAEQRNYEPDYDYVIGPGDNLQVFVWGNDELSTSASVRPDGKFTTHLVEDLPASGKTSTELARDIEKVYAEYVKHPVVSVIVNGYVGVPTQQVRVVGEASNPIGIPFRKHMTLLDLMIAVGGVTEFADGNNTVLVRNFEGRQASYRVRLDDLLKDGDITANVTLFPGDIVIIPESWF